MINNYNVTKATVRIAKHEGLSLVPYGFMFDLNIVYLPV